MRGRVAVGVLATTPLLLGLVGCGDDELSQDAAVRQVCEQRDAARQAVTDLREVDLEDLTADDLRSAADRIEEGVDDLDDAAEVLGAAGFDEVRAAVTSLVDVLDGLDGDEPLGDQAEEVVAAGRDVAVAWQEFVDQVDCE